MSEKYVFADVGRTGLCNMLYPWARALIYARNHQLDMLAPQWVKIGRLGPWLRGERYKRYYLGQFTNSGYVRGLRRFGVLSFLGKSVRRFSGLGNMLADFPSEASFLREELEKIVNPQIIDAVKTVPDKFIGVHIRRGDFVTIGQALDEDYYLSAVRKAREMAGKALPILVFSDAWPKELTYLSQVRDVRLMPKAPAVQDLLSLARASILVGTNLSTFSEWAAFLGGMPNIWSGRLPLPQVLENKILI